jgi:hypothetical protein
MFPGRGIKFQLGTDVPQQAPLRVLGVTEVGVLCHCQPLWRVLSFRPNESLLLATESTRQRGR